MTATFALTPGQIEADKILDMNSKLGREIYPPKTSTCFKVNYYEKWRSTDGMPALGIS